ncbi:MAG TPA: hypothetical protein VIH71_14060 [Solirubrobacteraceae bacterium]
MSNAGITGPDGRRTQGRGYVRHAGNRRSKKAGRRQGDHGKEGDGSDEADARNWADADQKIVGHGRIALVGYPPLARRWSQLR